MLFTTVTFICFFLPIVLAGFYAIARFSPIAAAFWLFAASVFFYGYWMPVFTLLLLASVAGNYLVGARIAFVADTPRHSHQARPKGWLVFGIVANLALLSYFKYANFFVDNLNIAFG
jgi:alginate O-acetyltransferase complex protein AlgI